MNKIASPLAAAVAIAFFATASLGWAQLAASRIAPTSTAAPVVSGTTTEGSTLTTSAGTWSSRGIPTYAYQWQRCSTATSCVAISGATKNTYLLATGDIGSQVRSRVTATNKFGSTVVNSALTAVIAPLPSSTPPPPPTWVAPANTALPTISGSALQGQVLTASNGTWTGTTPMTYAYQWYYCDSAGANCSPITGYTSQTYTPVVYDVGGRNKVQVTATNAAGGTAATSALTAVITAPSTPTVAPSLVSAPSVSGTVQQGQMLTASTGTWNGTTPMSYGYQWSRCSSSCASITGATGASYTLTSGDVGSSVRATVTASNTAGTATGQSAQTATVASPPPGGTGGTSGSYFSANFENGSLSPWDNVDLGLGTLAVNSNLTGGTSPGTVRLSNTGANGSHGAELTVTSTAHASPASSTDSVFLWNNVKSYLGHNTQETWETWKVMFPSPGFTPNASCGGGCPWFTEHHNDDSFLPYYNSGQVTWEYPNLVWGIITDHSVADGTIKPQIMMRIWGGDDNTPSQPNKSVANYVFTRQALQTNHWYTFKTHVVWSASASTGLVQWWLDGQLVYSANTPTLWRHPDGTVSAANFEVGNYRPHDTTTSTIYFDDFVLGPTEASIGG